VLPSRVLNSVKPTAVKRHSSLEPSSPSSSDITSNLSGGASTPEAIVHLLRKEYALHLSWEYCRGCEI